ncbi:hypothetical protein [Streptomyces barringtoniae]|nr:hypothetical protein [Streptomyces barringtoniae]MCC5481210.1 hypothetical protein [Streptomyces barringtoniae]
MSTGPDYADRDDADEPCPVREDDQQAHRPQEPGPHRGWEAGPLGA